MSGSNNPLQHPLQTVSAAIGAAGVDPRPLQNSTLFQGANEGPAAVASKITGLKQGGKRQDDAPYFTNNEAIPWPDYAHSKTVGGIPVTSDIFLLQKQQAFNRSKLLERKQSRLTFWTVLTRASYRYGPSLRQRCVWVL